MSNLCGSMESTKIHVSHMKQCIVLAKKAMTNGNFPVGSVVVKSNRIIGGGLEGVKPSNDVTKHAEIEAIKDALNNTGSNKLENCDLLQPMSLVLCVLMRFRHYRIKTLIYGAKVDHVGGITSDLKVMLTSKVPSWGSLP